MPDVISFTSTGDFNNLTKFLNAITRGNTIQEILEDAGREGVAALQAATPSLTGLAANSWYYEVTATPGNYRIDFMNSDIENGFPVAIMLQYGHGTRQGGYVQGRDYINPALQPVFDNITNQVWKAVTSA